MPAGDVDKRNREGKKGSVTSKAVTDDDIWSPSELFRECVHV
jgi:hypothetical protein